MRLEHRSASVPNVRAGRHRGALQPRVIGRAESLSGPSWLGLLIERGEITCRAAGAEERIAAPAVAWRPWGRGARAEIAPGAVVSYILVGNSALSNAIGHKPEAEDVRDLVDGPVTLLAGSAGTVMETLGTCFAAILREASTARGASGTLIEAYLRILVIELWRTQGGREASLERNSPSQRIFSQFTALVEQRFRERWTVSRYAETLGLSRDRLGDVCRRVRGRSPKDLVDRRTAREARLLLETSNNSIEQIAGLLGFQSAAQFGRFVHRMSGEPPGAVRRKAMQRGGTEPGAESASLHDWP